MVWGSVLEDKVVASCPKGPDSFEEVSGNPFVASNELEVASWEISEEPVGETSLDTVTSKLIGPTLVNPLEGVVSSDWTDVTSDPVGRTIGEIVSVPGVDSPSPDPIPEEFSVGSPATGDDVGPSKGMMNPEVGPADGDSPELGETSLMIGTPVPERVDSRGFEVTAPLGLSPFKSVTAETSPRLGAAVVPKRSSEIFPRSPPEVGGTVGKLPLFPDPC